MLSISPEMLQSHAFAFLENQIDVFANRRHAPKTSPWRNPGTPGEIVGNRATGGHAGIVGYVKPLAARAKGDHLDMAEISTWSSPGALADPRIAKIDEYTAKRSAVRRTTANRLPSSPTKDQFPILPVASR